MDNCIVSSFDVVLQRYLDGIYFGQRIYIFSDFLLHMGILQ